MGDKFKYPLRFRWAATIISVGMLVDSLRIFVIEDNPSGRIITLLIWCVIGGYWLTTLISFYRNRSLNSAE